MTKKHLAIISFLLAVSCLSISCEDISRSVQDTFAPGSSSASRDSVTDAVLEDTTDPPEMSAGSQPAEQETSKTTRSIAADPEALRLAEERLRALPEFQQKDILIYQSTHFYSNGTIRTSILDPEQEDYIDEYVYKDGRWEKGKPVVISGGIRVKDYLISLDQFSFRQAHRVYTALKEKAEEINSPGVDEPTVYCSSYKGRLRWYPQSISSDRFRYKIEFDSEGRLLSFGRE